MRDLKALAAFVAARQAMPFAWGSNDCVSFAAAGLMTTTGRDALAGIASWKSKATAMSMLAKMGGLEVAVSTVLREIPRAMAQRGDIAMVNGPDGPFLTINMGVSLVGPGPDCLLHLPHSQILKAWSAEA